MSMAHRLIRGAKAAMSGGGQSRGTTTRSPSSTGTSGSGGGSGLAGMAKKFLKR